MELLGLQTDQWNLPNLSKGKKTGEKSPWVRYPRLQRETEGCKRSVDLDL